MPDTHDATSSAVHVVVMQGLNGVQRLEPRAQERERNEEKQIAERERERETAELTCLRCVCADTLTIHLDD